MDARVIADLARANLVAESYVPDMQILEQRALRQLRVFVEDTVTRLSEPDHILLRGHRFGHHSIRTC
jgi:hypothetical protein